jgi:hypothetical protein
MRFSSGSPVPAAKGQVGGGDRLETSIVVYGSPVAFRLTAVVPEAKKSKRAASPAVDRSDRRRLSILDVQGSKPERFAWEDSEGRALEAQITDIATELVTTAEINYRDACVRRHFWISEKREALREHLEEERRATEVARRTQAVAVARARLDKLLGMAADYRQARTIRLFIGAMRRRSRDADSAVARIDFEDWCHWALAEADKLDPAKNLAKFSIESKQEKMTLNLRGIECGVAKPSKQYRNNNN